MFGLDLTELLLPLITAAGGALALAFAWWKGAQSEKQKQIKRRLDAIKEREKVDDESEKLGDDGRRKRLSDWVR